MNVFDLALDSGDEEWFRHLHNIQRNYNNNAVPVISNKVESVNNQDKDNGIASFTNLPSIDNNISQKDIIDHLKYWNVSNLLHSLNEYDGKLNNKSILETIEMLIRNRRRFYLEEALESEEFGE